MKNAYALLGVLFLVVFGGAYVLIDRSSNPEMDTMPHTDTEQRTEDSLEASNTPFMLTLTSPVFENGGTIPSKYTCDGDGINPGLNIASPPAGTKSFVLLMDDPDIPDEIKNTRGIEKFDHWVLYNIPPETNVIEAGTPAGEEGLNSRGDAKYTGPCPPKEYEPTEHRYIFRLYALDTVLNFESAPALDDVKGAMEGHVLQETELIGMYERQ